MAKETATNSYEEARKQQLLENQKRFEELGILKISRNLSDLSKSEKKSQQREVKPRIRNAEIVEPRRSARERKTVVTYQDEVDISPPNVRKRSKSDASWTSYISRPLEECRFASSEEIAKAVKSAQKLQSNLQSDYPSFIKTMGLPQSFCRAHLPKSTENMVLEDEDGNEYDAVFISKRTGLSGGWRAFALEHKIDEGDAVVFELIERTRFKVYIVKAYTGSEDDDDDMPNVEEEAENKTASMARKKHKTTLDSPSENEKTSPAKSNSPAEKTKQSKKKTSTAKSNSQDKNTKKSEITVTGTKRSTRLRNQK